MIPGQEHWPGVEEGAREVLTEAEGTSRQQREETRFKRTNCSSRAFPQGSDEQQRKCFTSKEICHNTRLHLQGKVARRAFAQESLKTMTSPTSARKTPTKSSKSWSTQDAHQILVSPGLLTFRYTFFHIKICLRTGSRGTRHFPPFFNIRFCYLKQYRRF